MTRGGRGFPRRRCLQAAAAVALAPLAGCSRPSGRCSISLWFSYGGKNRLVLLDLVGRFNREQAAVHVVPTFQGDYFEGLAKLRTALYAGAAPALSHVVAEVVPYLAEAGVLAPLEEVGDEVLRDLVPELCQAGTFAGGAGRPVVALPFNRSTPIAYFNRALFAELGLEPPRTWEELAQVARQATARRAGESVRWGFECPVDWWFWTAMVGQAGGELVEPDGTLSLGGAAGVRALGLWQKLARSERVMKPPPGRDYNAWEATNTDFLAGRAAMIWTSTAFLRYLEESASFPVGAAPLPRDRRAAVPTGGTMFVMPRGLGRAERQAGLGFLRWMMQPAQANEWATRTGYLPVSRRGLTELEKQGYYDRHPGDRVAVDQLACARPWPWKPELFRVQREAVQPRLEEAVLSGRDAAETLAEARRVAEQP